MGKVLAVVTLFVFVTVGVFGFLYPFMMIGGHSHGSGCLYMLGEQALCPMDSLEHFVAWQKTFTSVVSSQLLVIFSILSVLAISFSFRIRLNLFLKNIFRTRSLEYILTINPYQFLFSKGIFHPKAP